MPKNDKLVVEDKNGKKYLIPNRPDRIRHYMEQQFTVSKDQSLAMPKATAAKPEGGLKKFGRGAALGAFSGLGIPETQTPIKDLAKGLVSPPKPSTGDIVGESILGPGYRAAKGIFGSAGEAAEAVGANPRKPWQFGPVDIEKLGHGLGSLAAQILALKGGKEATEAPIAESEVIRGGKAVGEGIAEVPPKVVQSASLARYEVNKAEAAAKAAAEKKLADYQKAAEEAKSTATRELAASRSKHVSETAEQIGKTKELAKKYKENLASKRQIEAENTRNEATRQVLTRQAETGTKELTNNLKQTLDNTKASFDKEYADFDSKILGKSAAKPKGTLQAQLSPLAESVQNAKENIIEGSPESIKQFENILKEGTDPLLAQASVFRKGGAGVDVKELLSSRFLNETQRNNLLKSIKESGGEPEAGVSPIGPEATIPASDLRGYITELESKIYDGNLLPDVKAAVKSVVQAGKAELESAIGEAHGKSAVAAYKDLNSRYSDYLTDWRDISRTNPLPRVRKVLLEGVTTKNPNYPVHLDVARILKGANAQKALVLLDKYKKFGAEPKLLANYNKALELLDEIPNPKKVPEVTRPTYPEPARSVPVKLPASPEAPEIEPFNRQAMMQDVLEKRINQIGRIGQLFKVLNIPVDILQMRGGAALSQAGEIALIEMVRRLMTNPRVLEYLSREK